MYAKLQHVKIFHLGYPPLLPGLVKNDGAELVEIFTRVQSMGVVTSLDMVVPDPNSFTGRADWPSILRKTLPFVDVFIPSIDEILYMLRRDDAQARAGGYRSPGYLRALADELIAMGVGVAGFKLGADGMYLRTASADRLRFLTTLGIDPGGWAEREHFQPAFAVEVRGTTGAGDSAYAGFLTALLHAQSPENALRWACAVGAHNVEAADSISGLRSLSDTLARIDAGWPTR